MEIEGQAESLKGELLRDRSEFDSWITSEFNLIRAVRSEQLQWKTEFEAEMRNVAQERKKQQQQIEKNKREEERSSLANQAQKEREQLLRVEIESLPKEVKHLAELRDILKQKKEKIETEKENREEADRKICQELEKWEALYGLSVRVDGNTVSFKFRDSDAPITLQEDSQHMFSVIEAPQTIMKIQAIAMKEFNTKRNLCRLLAKFRSAL